MQRSYKRGLLRGIRAFSAASSAVLDCSQLGILTLLSCCLRLLGFIIVSCVYSIKIKMSFGLPSVKPQPLMPARFDVSQENSSLPNVMTHGITSANGKLGSCHPLEMSENMYVANKHKMNMMVLRNTQGLHAPLRLAMELKAAKQVGRLSFLPSSNLMTDVLTGRDDEIGFEDILNTAEFREQMGQPHAMIEKQLGIL